MASEILWAIRGATTVDVDTPEEIGLRTTELLDEIITRNNISHDQVISVFFTTTADVTSAFPATAARLGGFEHAALMCAQEIPVPGALAQCIRLMMQAGMDRPRSEIENVYLRGAKGLRNDLKR